MNNVNTGNIFKVVHTQPQEDIESIAAVDVADGAVGMRLPFGRDTRRKQIGQRSSKRHDGEAGKAFARFKVTTGGVGQVTNQGGEQGDDQYGHEEGDPATQHTHRRNEGVHNIPMEVAIIY